MNNDQFRKLYSVSSQNRNGPENDEAKSRGKDGSFRSYKRADVLMKPRAVLGPRSRFAKSPLTSTGEAEVQWKAVGPKESTLAARSTDRTRVRNDETSDERRKRLSNLEESLKKGEIDRTTYDTLRFEIAGGTLESTHLVKGLDFKLLERVRRGELHKSKSDDSSAQAASTLKDGEVNEDIDEAFTNLKDLEIRPLEKKVTEKKSGHLSVISSTSGKSRSRDRILDELKASRAALRAQKTSSLGSRFKKIGVKQQPGTRIERDKKGREVLIIVDEDSHERRKVRKVTVDEETDNHEPDLPMPDPNAAPLGMEVPDHYKKQQQAPETDSGSDIFEGAGDDYDPLADVISSESGEEEEGEVVQVSSGEQAQPLSADGPAGTGSEVAAEQSPTRDDAAKERRNYFKGSKTGLLSAEVSKGPSASDPNLMAAIKRAAKLHHAESADPDGFSTTDQEQRRRKLLAASARDDADLDLGFGTSRLEDEEDLDESQTAKLATWDAEGSGTSQSRGGQKRKRGPKKRKGDVNSAADVLRVMEQRKKS